MLIIALPIRPFTYSGCGQDKKEDGVPSVLWLMVGSARAPRFANRPKPSRRWSDQRCVIRR